MVDTQNNGVLSNYTNLFIHWDSSFWNAFYVFLVIQGALLVAFTETFKNYGKFEYNLILYSICFIGIIISILWLFVMNRKMTYTYGTEKEIKKLIEPVYESIYRLQTTFLTKRSSAEIVKNGIPLIFIFLWFVFFIILFKDLLLSLFTVYLIVFILTLMTLFIFVFMIFLYSYFNTILRAWERTNELYLINSEKEYFPKENEKYIGIVITNSGLPKRMFERIRGPYYRFIFRSEPMLLIEHFKKRKKHVRILKEDNPENPFNISALDEMIYDPNCYEMYILGHGTRYGLYIGKNKGENIYYDKYRGASKKDKVVQLHCNHIKLFDKNKKRPSLTQVLNANTDIKQKGKRLFTKNVDYFLKLDKEKN